MRRTLFDRAALHFRPLHERRNRVEIVREAVPPDAPPGPLSDAAHRVIEDLAGTIRAARRADRPVVLAVGAHAIKNGLGLLLTEFLKRGWVTHVATNGAGMIHDWEFAYQGASSEDVRENVARGQFGLWEETGCTLNLALSWGAFAGLGYGESVGALIAGDGFTVPESEELLAVIRSAGPGERWRAAAAADLLDVVEQFRLTPGPYRVSHPFKQYSVQAGAYTLGVPCTAHPMFGHDIIYTHPMNRGASVGRTAERDFLMFADAIRRLDGGVYLSVGSAVMSPMIFEKAFSMAQNIALQHGASIGGHRIVVVDLAASVWDWQSQGEPPPDNPAYYLRFCKSFSRMGGRMDYVTADNRAFLLTLFQTLDHPAAASGS